MSENGGTGKSGSSSGAGTPRGQDSGSVSPTHDGNMAGLLTGSSTAFSKSIEGTGSEDKLDSVVSWSLEEYWYVARFEIIIIYNDTWNIPKH